MNKVCNDSAQNYNVKNDKQMQLIKPNPVSTKKTQPRSIDAYLIMLIGKHLHKAAM